ncbi:hypothetical protein EYF80_010788 [Liparis tanakae]|uniref:Uncharacterized protein n=1 Tax=Liparis tanakae TaxID=230148 RepID=A0A4Z2IM53_9TELE|nr:hypothetical protein EYF80_010788 [Liparis tanakae]
MQPPAVAIRKWLSSTMLSLMERENNTALSRHNGRGRAVNLALRNLKTELPTRVRAQCRVE